MTRDDRFITLLTDWLEEQPATAPDQLLDTVLTDLQTASQRARWRSTLRRFPMFGSNLVRYAAVAVVGLLAVVIAVGLWAGGGGVGAPSPGITPTPPGSVTPGSPVATSSQTPIPTPSAAASARPLPPSGQLDPGTYLYPRGGFAAAAFTFTVPDGWVVQNAGWNVGKRVDQPGELGFWSSVIGGIYSDSCAEGADWIEVGPSVDDLANALLEQPGGAIAQGPFDVSLGGYPGLRIDLAPPPAAELEGCRLPGGLQFWLDRAGNYSVLSGDGRASVYIVDVDGARLVLGAGHRESSPAADVAELNAIIESIEIQP
jgi:hypothetical protein